MVGCLADGCRWMQMQSGRDAVPCVEGVCVLCYRLGWRVGGMGEGKVRGRGVGEGQLVGGG